MKCKFCAVKSLYGLSGIWAASALFLQNSSDAEWSRQDILVLYGQDIAVWLHADRHIWRLWWCLPLRPRSHLPLLFPLISKSQDPEWFPIRAPCLSDDRTVLLWCCCLYTQPDRAYLGTMCHQSEGLHFHVVLWTMSEHSQDICRTNV